MGTSGSYGGSSAAGWGNARQAYEHMADPGDGAAAAAGEGGEGAQDETGPTAADVAAAIAQALWDEDLQVRRPTPPAYPTGSLLPRRPGGGGGGGGGRGSTGTSGRVGGRSSRQVAKGAQRGGAAVAAAYALRRGDTAALAQHGLDLAELAGLDVFTQSARILDAVLGEAGHPDERALRKASLEQVKEILRAEEEPTPVEMLRGLAAAFVFELGIIELRAQRKGGAISAEEARRKEIEIRAYIVTCARGIPDTFGPVVTDEQFREVAGRLATNTLRVLRAGVQAA
jgi:hypothetical protein